MGGGETEGGEVRVLISAAVIYILIKPSIALLP